MTSSICFQNKITDNFMTQLWWRSLYLSSKNCYQVLREYLHLPHPNTIKSYFGALITPGSVTDCRNIIVTVFNKLSWKEKYCKVLVDETYVTPALRYQGNHIIRFPHDKPAKAARTVLAIIIAPVMGVSAFVCRLIPVYTQSFPRTNKNLSLLFIRTEILPFFWWLTIWQQIRHVLLV